MRPDVWETVRMEGKSELTKLKKISETVYGCSACKNWEVTMEKSDKLTTAQWQRRLDKHFAKHLHQCHYREETTSDEATEVRKQFGAYADAITAFATAQSVGFMLLMTHGDCFTKNVLSGLSYAITFGCIANVAYIVLVFLCHRRADKIPKEESGAIAPALRGVWTLRYIIIVIDLLATVFVTLGINYGWHHAQFFIDCKGTSQIIRDVTLF